MEFVTPDKANTTVGLNNALHGESAPAEPASGRLRKEESPAERVLSKPKRLGASQPCVLGDEQGLQKGCWGSIQPHSHHNPSSYLCSNTPGHFCDGDAFCLHCQVYCRHKPGLKQPRHCQEALGMPGEGAEKADVGGSRRDGSSHLSHLSPCHRVTQVLRVGVGSQGSWKN